MLKHKINKNKSKNTISSHTQNVLMRIDIVYGSITTINYNIFQKKVHNPHRTHNERWDDNGRHLNNNNKQSILAHAQSTFLGSINVEPTIQTSRKMFLYDFTISM